jgi:hypothetical protein
MPSPANRFFRGRLLADPELANDLGHRCARLGLLQSERDLLFRKVLLSHP